MTDQILLSRAPQASSWQAENASGSVSADALARPRDVDLEAAIRMIETLPGLVILDVRTPVEFAEGRVRQSVNLDFYADGFDQALSGLDRQAAYLVYCRCGGRSAYTLDMMDELGFTNVLHMPAGMDGWREAGLPVCMG